jgi:hypothetical protein
VQPGSGNEEVPFILGHSRSSLLSPGGHSLGVQPAVPERRKQGLSEFRRSPSTALGSHFGASL